MQVVKNTLLVLVSLWFALVAFMPKEELYYTLEHKLVDYGIELNEKSIKSGIFSLEISDVDIYIEGIKIAHVDHMDFLITLLFNNLNIYDITLDDALNSLIHFDIKTIQKANATYSILSPVKSDLSLEGNFGKAIGYINIHRVLHLDFPELNSTQSLKNILQKDDNGWYYETKF